MKLTTRLSAFFLASLAIVLVGFSVALFVSARIYLHRQVDDRLASALAVLSAAAEVHPDGVEWEASERELTLGQTHGPDRLRWIVFDGDGQVVDRSPNLDDPGLSPEWTQQLGSTKPPERLRDRRGSAWKMALRRLGPVDRAGDAPYPRELILTVAAPLAPVELTLGTLSLFLVGVSLAVWSVAAILGRWMVRRALAPLTQLVRSAQELDATDPGWSLPTTATGDELDDLGRAFNDLLARLRVAFERQRRFSSDASHQLRTPLTALVGQIEVALRRDREPEEYRRVMGLLRGQARGLAQIVEALLFLGRADSEAGLPEATPLDLAAWIAGHLGGHPLAGTIAVEANGPVWVRAHAPLLAQLVDNLLDNAAKYGHPGETIVVRVDDEAGSARLVVEDHGPGIEPVDLPRVFEPFFRSIHARRRGRQGVGLGLAVVQRIATAFGGTIAVESVAGQGCRFVLKLPRIDPPDAELRVGQVVLAGLLP